MTPPGLPSIGPRLAKLVPMLGSNQPGEVAAAVAAISRTLAGAGLDWHALAGLITAEAKRQTTPAFTFATLSPRAARKRIAMLTGRPGLPIADGAQLERLREWLHREPPGSRLPPDQVTWLDGLWREAFGGG